MTQVEGALGREGNGIGEVLINIGSDSIIIRRQGVQERRSFPTRPFPKTLQARKSPETATRKSNIPDDLKPAYESVEAGLLSVLGMSSSEDVGDQGLQDRGGSDSPHHNLNLLRTKLSNRQIAEEFMNSRAMKEYKEDPFALDKVITALGTLRNAFPI